MYPDLRPAVVRLWAVHHECECDRCPHQGVFEHYTVVIRQQTRQTPFAASGVGNAATLRAAFRIAQANYAVAKAGQAHIGR